MSFLRRLAFKFMELGLGLRPCFSLQTRDPIFLNFRLRDDEVDAVRRALPPGFTLRPLRFTAADAEPAYWVSYNLYELRYPREDMAQLRKVRCEINTFVRDADGRDGVFVFCGSPFVSREERPSAMGRVADLAERIVIALYGCGRLTRLRYELAGGRLRVELDEPESSLALDLPLAAPGGPAAERLSDDYHRFNDVSFFAGGRSHDLVHADSRFTLATFEPIDPDAGPGAAPAAVAGPFFRRPPDRVYLHRGEIGYLVSALHTTRGGVS